MAFINNAVPEQSYVIEFAGAKIEILPFQLVVWASLAPSSEVTLSPNAPKFPVLLDTGHSHNFSLTVAHLREWAQREISDFRKEPKNVRVTDASGKTLTLSTYDADIWLYSTDKSTPAFRVELDGGFSFYPDDPDVRGPRLPLLGGRAVCTAKLHLTIDGSTRHFSVSLP